MKVIFSHGKESGPWGSKITKLANVAESLGFNVDSIDYRHVTDPDKRVNLLNAYLANESQPYILVGSSMGGYVSLVTSQKNEAKGLFLLAPALYIQGYQHQQYVGNCNFIDIVHGWSDSVIPVENSITFAKSARCNLFLIDGDHRLNSAIEQVIVLFKQFLERVEASLEN